jgi:serine/threonine protein kinase
VSELERNDPLLNRVIEGYHFIKRLGEGSYGLVYLARHPRIKERLVAIKYLKLGNVDDIKKVEREVDILARLQHPNVVNILDTYRFDHYQLIVMELIRGGSLHNALFRLSRQVDVKPVVEIVEHLAFALGYVHSQNILHLDLKPANILLDPIADGQEARFVLTDFGIAEMVKPDDHRSTNVVGTPVYMSPEHFGFGDNKPDGRSDIYSLGIILYELLVGTVPYHATKLLDLLNHHAYSEIPLPSKAIPGIPPELDEVILRSMAKSPVDRYQSANEMGSALRDIRNNALINWNALPERASGQALGIIAQAGANAMESVRGELPPEEEPSAFNLQIMKPDGSTETTGFQERSVIVGRDKGVGLQLDQKTVSRRHAQIDCDRKGNVYITDLDSANGTFLDGVRLAPNERVLWRLSQYVQIQGFLLQVADLAGEEVEAVPFAFTTDQVMVLFDELQKQQRKPRLRFELTPDVVYLDQGKPQYVQVRVSPEDTPVARYELRAQPGPGIDERWYTLPAGQVIQPNDAYTFDFMVSSPTIGTIGGSTHEIVLEATSDNSEIPSAVQILKVRVVPFTRFIAALKPNEVSHDRKRRSDLSIINSGNQKETFSIEIEAPDTLKLIPTTPQIDIGPADEKSIRLKFKPARDARRARNRLVYSITVHSLSGMTERVNGSYVFRQRQRIPNGLWLLWILLLIIIGRQIIFDVSVQTQFEQARDIIDHLIQQVTG